MVHSRNPEATIIAHVAIHTASFSILGPVGCRNAQSAWYVRRNENTNHVVLQQQGEVQSRRRGPTPLEARSVQSPAAGGRDMQ